MKQTNKEFHPARRIIQLQFTFSQFIKRLTVNTKIIVCAITKISMKPAIRFARWIENDTTKEFCKE